MMDDFVSLSIQDEYDKSTKNEDLIGISNLCISEGSKLPQQLICKFMPHVPVSPSPLRNAFHVEMLQEDMEIDEEGINVPPEDQVAPLSDNTRGSSPNSVFEEQRGASNGTAVESETEKEIEQGINAIGKISLGSTKDDDDLLDDSEVTEKGDESGDWSDINEEQSIDKKSVIKALLSPTTLGIAAATKHDPTLRPSLINAEMEKRTKVTEEPEIETIDKENMLEVNGVVDRSATEYIKQELRSRAKRNEPIHVSINTHNHYYPTPQQYMDNGISNSKQYEFVGKDINIHQAALLHDELQQKKLYSLPDPWSPQSQPASRHWYAITSYLQYFLNVVTLGILCAIFITLVHAFKADVQAIWHQHKVTFEQESLDCKRNFYENKCDRDTPLPALIDQCHTWSKCMSRDNDKLFTARISLVARILGSILNSFIEPLGWKALLVLFIGCTIWCFSTNFLLGFARARSYYGHNLEDRIKKLELTRYYNQDHSEPLQHSKLITYNK
ncbi:uncharacterized protein GVI51_D03905 [Nakaseomyces glabratus]|nr:Di-sulfide bridge nucleocytoplasmic transport domain [Nakaseomyces glabratus]KAH7596675.1 Di-sulfide bridge nucleocytoplasmic transport domain [Nakaseomyces glabratus]KAH7608035.1 Di-sulfide bridge nucleocytoplasmic transport domain [Nakaseomyces glabratus]KAH7608441.1 Di-sulfide bridge nucleocytoplasmic transport domain [Nakaseomyces glabratus]QHS65222.1 uncharacterized protein GVI51_D03905 [Nakaseomyces glabratus]